MTQNQNSTFYSGNVFWKNHNTNYMSNYRKILAIDSMNNASERVIIYMEYYNNYAISKNFEIYVQKMNGKEIINKKY